MKRERLRIVRLAPSPHSRSRSRRRCSRRRRSQMLRVAQRAAHGSRRARPRLPRLRPAGRGRDPRRDRATSSRSCKAVRNEAHRLIEEFMLAANEAVAKHLEFVPTPALYRVHDRPDESRLADLRVVLGPLGYDLPEDEEEVTPGRRSRRSSTRRRESPRSASSRTSSSAPRRRPSTPRSAAGTTRSRRSTTATSRRRSGATRTSSSTAPSWSGSRSAAPPARRGRGGPHALVPRGGGALLVARAARRVGRARGRRVEEVRLPVVARRRGVLGVRLGGRGLRPLRDARGHLRGRPRADLARSGTTSTGTRTSSTASWAPRRDASTGSGTACA